MMISIAMKTTRSVMNNDGVVISRSADRAGPTRRSDRSWGAGQRAAGQARPGQGRQAHDPANGPALQVVRWRPALVKGDGRLAAGYMSLPRWSWHATKATCSQTLPHQIDACPHY